MKSQLKGAFKQIQSKMQYLRLTPFPGTTSEDRAKERYRRAALTSVASILSRVISISATLISVPLTYNYLGAERYGMWMAMSSLIILFSFADLGMGNGLLNSIAAAFGRDNFGAIAELVSSGYAVLTLIALILGIGFFCVYPFIRWERLFNVKTAKAMAESGPTFAALVVCFAIAIPANVVQKVQSGLQQGFMGSLWQCFSSILGLVGIVVAVTFSAGLPWLVLALVGAPLVASILNSVIYFSILQPQLAPRPSWIKLAHIKDISSKGGLFFILQVVAAVSFSADAFLISQVLGADVVAQFSVPDKLFAVISSIMIMFLSPLWPAYGEANARGDFRFIQTTLKRSLILTTSLAFVFSTALIILCPFIIHIWVGPEINVPFSIVLGLGVWRVIEAACNALSVFLNGTGVVKTQIIVCTITCIGNLSLKFYFLHAFGVSGSIWATILATVGLTVVPYTVMVARYFRNGDVKKWSFH